jgi:hypothetical protein
LLSFFGVYSHDWFVAAANEVVREGALHDLKKLVNVVAPLDSINVGSLVLAAATMGGTSCATP